MTVDPSQNLLGIDPAGCIDPERRTGQIDRSDRLRPVPDGDGQVGVDDVTMDGMALSGADPAHHPVMDDPRIGPAENLQLGSSQGS